MSDNISGEHNSQPVFWTYILWWLQIYSRIRVDEHQKRVYRIVVLKIFNTEYCLVRQ